MGKKFYDKNDIEVSFNHDKAGDGSESDRIYIWLPQSENTLMADWTHYSDRLLTDDDAEELGNALIEAARAHRKLSKPKLPTEPGIYVIGNHAYELYGVWWFGSEARPNESMQLLLNHHGSYRKVA